MHLLFFRFSCSTPNFKASASDEQPGLSVKRRGYKLFFSVHDDPIVGDEERWILSQKFIESPQNGVSLIGSWYSYVEQRGFGFLSPENEKLSTNVFLASSCFLGIEMNNSRIVPNHTRSEGRKMLFRS